MADVLTKQGVRNLDLIGPRPKPRKDVGEMRYCPHSWIETYMETGRQWGEMGDGGPVYDGKRCAKCGIRKEDA